MEQPQVETGGLALQLLAGSMTNVNVAASPPLNDSSSLSLSQDARLANDMALFAAIQQENQKFDIYEQQYQELMLELEAEPVLDAFRQEYRVLHNSFLRCNEGERRLLNKCADLRGEQVTCTAKVHAAQELSLEDKDTIRRLESEIQRSKERAAACADRERSLRESVVMLREDVVELQRRLDAGPTKIESHESMMHELKRTVEVLQKEQEIQEYQVTSLRRETEQIERRIAKGVEDSVEDEELLRGLRAAILQKQSEIEAQRIQKTQAEAELCDLREALVRQSNVTAGRAEAIERQVAATVEKAAEQRDAEGQVERATLELQQLARKTHQLDASVQANNEENDALQKQVNDVVEQLARTEAETAAVAKRRAKEVKVVEALRRRNMLAAEQRDEAVQEKEALLHELQLKKDEHQRLQVRLESDYALVKAARKELNLLKANLTRAETQTQAKENWACEKASQKKHLQHERSAYSSQAQAQMVRIHQVTKEALQYEEESRKAATAASMVMETVRDRQREIESSMARQREIEGRLKQQRDLLEMVLRERHVYAKHFIRLREDTVVANQHFKQLLQQVKQVKSDIERLERDLAVEDAIGAKLDRQRKETLIVMDSTRRKVEQRERNTQALENEAHRLGATLAVAEEEMTRQQRDARATVTERNALGDQVVRKDAELAQLYDTLRAQKGLLRKSVSENDAATQRIRQLEANISSMTAELEQLQDIQKQLPELRTMLNVTEKELWRERTRVRALQSEAESGQGVHIHANRQRAWCLPHVDAIAKQIRSLQRQLVDSTSRLERVTRQIAEHESTYVSLKAIAARLPGPEVAEQLQAYQETQPKRMTHLKAMKSSLKQFHEKVDVYKSRMEELNEELREVHEEYARRRNVQERELTAARAAASRLKSLDCESREPGSSEDEEYIGFVAPPRLPSPSASPQPQSSSPPLPPPPPVVSNSDVVDEAVESDLEVPLAPRSTWPAATPPTGRASTATLPVMESTLNGRDTRDSPRSSVRSLP